MRSRRRATSDPYWSPPWPASASLESLSHLKCHLRSLGNVSALRAAAGMELEGSCRDLRSLG